MGRLDYLVKDLVLSAWTHWYLIDVFVLVNLRKCNGIIHYWRYISIDLYFPATEQMQSASPTDICNTRGVTRRPFKNTFFNFFFGSLFTTSPYHTGVADTRLPELWLEVGVEIEWFLVCKRLTHSLWPDPKWQNSLDDISPSKEVVSNTKYIPLQRIRDYFFFTFHKHLPLNEQTWEKSPQHTYRHVWATIINNVIKVINSASNNCLQIIILSLMATVNLWSYGYLL